MEQEEGTEGSDHCQVVRWTPEEGLLSEKILKEGTVDAGGGALTGDLPLSAAAAWEPWCRELSTFTL